MQCNMSIVVSELSPKPYEAFIKQDDGFPLLFLNNLLNSVLQITVKKKNPKQSQGIVSEITYPKILMKKEIWNHV